MSTFSDTLNRLSCMINSRLRPEVSKVWVQGVNAGNTRLVFTIFYTNPLLTPLNCGYVMRFLEVKNFRHYRADGDIENEESLLENYINNFRRVIDDIIE